MKLYLELLKNPVFTLDDVTKITKHVGSAKNKLVRLVDQGYVKRIRKNLYTCVSPITGCPIANKYQIASAITDSSYVSHYTALEYYGFIDQIYYVVYVSSKERFKEFEFDGYLYKCVHTKHDKGITHLQRNFEIKISDLEKTVVDSIKDMDKIAGVEEIISSIELIPTLDENKIYSYLNDYDNQFLFQKVGYLFEYFKIELNISDEFLSKCHHHIGKSKRYLSKDINCDLWNSKWNIGTSSDIFGIKNGG